MDWGELIVAVLVAVGIIGILGLPLAFVLGLRGLWMAAVAPAFAVTVISGSAVVAGLAGIPWSVIVPVVAAVVIGVAVWLIRHAVSAPAMVRPRWDPVLFASLLVAAALVAAQIVMVLGRPDAISQTFDDIFHLNAVRYILETRNASSLTLGQMTFPGGGLGFYPAAWHGVVSLVAQLSGVSIPVAVNAVTIVIGALIWPLGALLLTRVLFGRSRALTVTAALVSASIPVFPLLLMDYGVLYPFQLGVALLPTALAAVIRLLRIVPGARDRLPHGIWIVVLVGVVPGMAIAHPGAVVAWLALTVPAAIVVLVRRWRVASGVRRWRVAAVFVGYLAVGAVLVRVLRPPADARGWPPSRTPLDALVDVVTLSPWYGAPAVLVSALVLLGIVGCLRSRSAAALAAVGMLAIAAGLYLTVAAMPLLRVRDALTGSWYNDLPRVASFLAVTAVPLAAYGGAWALERLRAPAIVRRAAQRVPARVGVVIGVAGAALFALALQFGPLSPVAHAVGAAQASFRMDDGAPLLSSDELALLERVPDHVPAGTVIAGSPWTGASLAFALADRSVLMPHTLMLVTDPVEIINDELADARPGSAVCVAVDELNVGFVLDFPGPEVHGGRHDFPGLDGLAQSGAVRLVDQEGDARLYAIVGCRA